MPAPKDPEKRAAWIKKIKDSNPMHKPESRLKSSLSHKGKPPANKGVPHTEETKQKLKEAWVIRKLKFPPLKHTEETKKKISDAHTGRKHSEKSRKNMSEAHSGKPLSKKQYDAVLKRVQSIEFRTAQSERRSGENCTFWKGGVSFEPYCIKFNNDFKRRVRAFFNNICVECGKPAHESSRNHHVHHVNYDKDVCCNDSPHLFVILCPSCHIKTNLNRDYWKSHFTELINSKYGGKCYFTKEEYRGNFT